MSKKTSTPITTPVHTSPELLWMLLKKGNSFTRKGVNGEIFSAEPGNLYNKHSYKFSGLANDRVVDIQASKDGNIILAKKSTKQEGKKYKTNVAQIKKHQKGVNKAISSEVRHYRPDLQKAALARSTALKKSTKSKK